MVTYAQTNGTTIAATNLNNAFREEVSNAAAAWSDKYKHLWRFNAHFHTFNTSSTTIGRRRYFYAPDDMFLVGVSAGVVNNAAGNVVFTVTLAGDTESVAGDGTTVSFSQTVSASSNAFQKMTRVSFDAATDEKFFIRKGALYYLEINSDSATGNYAAVSAVFAVAKRST